MLKEPHVKHAVLGVKHVLQQQHVHLVQQVHYQIMMEHAHVNQEQYWSNFHQVCIVSHVQQTV